MRTLLGLLGVLGVFAGIALGLYLGIWVMLVGGIVGIVSVISTMFAGGGIIGTLLAWSIVKIMFAGVVGWMSAFLIVIPSFALVVGVLEQ